MMSDKRTAVTAWESLFRAQVAVMRHLNAEFPDDIISFNEYDVLLNLSQQDDRRLRIKELNRHLLLTQPSVSRLIDRLVSRDIVRKQVDPHDARGIIVELTEHGYEVFRRVAVEHIGSISERVGGALSELELMQLTQLTEKLRKACE